MKANEIKNACQCSDCQKMCFHPCWPTPDEARAIIAAGYGPRLRADYWAGSPDILVLSGALAGREGEIKPPWPSNERDRCTFFQNGLCELHDKDLKPLEGALAHHAGGDDTGVDLHEKIAMMWNNPEAQKLANNWIAAHGNDDLEPQSPPGLFGLLRGIS